MARTSMLMRSTWAVALAVLASGCLREELPSTDVVHMQVSADRLDVPKGTVLRLRADGTLSNGEPVILTPDATWESSDPSIATVANEPGRKGQVSTLAEGTVRITARYRELSASAELKVGPKQLVSISVAPAALRRPAGLDASFTASGTFTDGTVEDVTRIARWVATPASVAEVSNADGERGRATALTPGSARIAAQIGEIVGTAIFDVEQPIVTRLEVDPPAAQIAKGTTRDMVAIAILSDGSKRDVTSVATWATSDSAVAVVEQLDGRVVVRGLTRGEARIRAEHAGFSGEAPTQVTDAVLTSLVVAPNMLSLPKGARERFVLTGLYSDGTNQVHTLDATWTSSDEAVLSFSGPMPGDGVATGVGQAIATAQYGGLSATAQVTVTPAALESLTLTPGQATLPKTTTLRLVATGTYSDSTTRDLTSVVSWASSDPSIATVGTSPGNEGIVTGVSTGVTTITASYLGKVPSATITVSRAPLTALSVDPPSASVPKGVTQPFRALGSFDDGSTADVTAEVVWSSSDANVAAVSNAQGTNGRATGMNVGSATISATLSGKTASAAMSVTPAVLVSLEVTPSAVSLPKGSSANLALTSIWSDGTKQDVTDAATWSSSDPSVASVSMAPGSAGRITANAVGSATVTASYGGKSASAGVAVTAAALQAIEVTPTAPSIAKGTRQQFAATGIYSDSSTQDLTAQATWTTADGAIASISNAAFSRGLAEALSVGTTRVTATMSGISGSTDLTVTPATLDRIDVTPTNPSVPKGMTQQMIATGTYSDMSTRDLTGSVSWSTSDSNVATISNASGNQGLATAMSVGTAVLTATLGSVSGSTTLTVTPALLTGLSISPTDATSVQATTRPFKTFAAYSDGSSLDVTASATWTSSNPAVATISNAAGSEGLATAVAPGTTTISATFSGVAASTTFTVVSGTLTSITVLPDDPSSAKGTTRQFVAMGTYSDGSTQDITSSVTWSSSQQAVATISNAGGSQGLATAVNVGSTQITATQNGISGQTTFTVTAATLVSIEITPVNASISAGATQQFAATGTFSDSTTQDLTQDVTWSSSDSSIATASNAPGSKGVVTGVAPGSATISATFSGKTGAVTVSVTP